jgi:hypothetical protein
MDYTRLKAAIVVLSMLGALAASPIQAQAPDSASPPLAGVGRIEFENDTIALLRIHMAPHEKTPMHDILSARLVIWLTDVHLRDTGADGTVIEYERPAGSFDWITPRRHMGENLSEQDLEFVAVIPKAAAAGPHGKSRH